MKKFFLALVLLVNFFTVSHADEPIVLQTQIGNITLPTDKELSEQLNLLKEDTTTPEDEKKKLEILYQVALDNFSRIAENTTKQKNLDNTLKQANKHIVKLSNQLTKEQNAEPTSKAEIAKLTQKQLEEAITKAQQDLTTCQLELSAAGDYHNNIQTLPEKAQNIITLNNDKVKGLISSIDKDSSPTLFKNRATALLIYSSNLESNFYKNQLANLSILQDLTNYYLKISSLKYARLEKNLKNLQYRKNVDFADTSSSIDLNELKKKNPNLEKLINSEIGIQTYINEHRVKYANLEHDYQAVDSAYAKVEQMDKDLSNQIKEIGKSLVLSRLLNKQLSLMPEISLNYDLDETIANLNIYIYEIREQLDKLMDVEKVVQNEIRINKALEDNVKDLTAVYILKRRSLNELYQVLANELSTAISLRVKYTEYKTISEKIKYDIQEQLFWVKSNHSIGADFVKMIIPTIKYESRNLILKLSQEQFITNTTNTVKFIILPFVFLSFIVLALHNWISRNNNKLARCLDRAEDSIFVTPLAIVNNAFMMLPQLCWKVIIGSIVICLALANTKMQGTVILIMVLHIFVFTFFLQIVKPNALLQRHFSVPPYKLAKFRSSLNIVWLFALPLLIFANVAETDSNYIYADITSHLVVLISFIALFAIFTRLFINSLKDYNSSSATTVITCITGMLVTGIALMFVALGYLYSVVTLTNRIAYSCYIVLAYYLVSQTVHRMIYVYLHKAFLNINANKDHNENHLLASLNVSPSVLFSKVYKLVNVLLIATAAFFLYLQWNDLASVLRYLDTVHLWSNSELINGKLEVTDYLSLSDILLAIAILIFTSILNKNLPSILEKLFQIRKTKETNSTSYTAKVISSYVITGLGIVAAAAAIGIHWENLQWLVAALSVGLGFGLQEIFANFVSGLILLFERQLRVGDIITLNGLSGTVSKIRIRATTVISFENKEVMIPNREFITSALTNWSLTDSVTKMEFVVGVAYDADVEKAKNLLKQIVYKCKYISKDKACLIYVKELAASSVNIAADIYVGNIGDRKLTIDYLSRETLSAFAQNGIEIPFNQLDVNVKTLEKDEFIKKLKVGLFNKEQEKAPC